MKAMAINKQSHIEERPLSLIEKPIPRPADNQILVKADTAEVVCQPFYAGEQVVFVF